MLVFTFFDRVHERAVIHASLMLPSPPSYSEGQQSLVSACLRPAAVVNLRLGVSCYTPFVLVFPILLQLEKTYMLLGH